MIIEILHVRDSDGGCEHVVFIDSEAGHTVHVETIDPGRGYLLSDWDEHTGYVDTNDDLTEPFRDAVVAERNEVRTSTYIEDDS